MTPDSANIHEILADCTQMYRKGEVERVEQLGTIRVTHIDAMPPTNQVPVSVVEVDMHFFVCGVRKDRAEAHREAIEQYLRAWPAEAWGYPVPSLKEGPSYIHAGGVIGDQSEALCLFAVGEVLGLWRVITPGRLGIHGSDADGLAGGGLVMVEGYTPAPAEEESRLYPTTGDRG